MGAGIPLGAMGVAFAVGAVAEAGPAIVAKMMAPTMGGIPIGKAFNSQQQALIQIVQRAKDIGKALSSEDVDAIKRWAQEYGVRFRGPEIHPERNVNFWHIIVGPVNHIPTEAP